MENTVNNEMPQNEAVNSPASETKRVDLEDLVCCDAFSIENIEKLKSEFIAELTHLISSKNKQNAENSFREENNLPIDVRPDSEISVKEASEEADSSDSANKNQLLQDGRPDMEISEEEPWGESETEIGFEEESEQAIIFRQADQLLKDVHQSLESSETLSESQPEESEELDRIKQLLRTIPQDVHEYTKAQSKDPDLFRQADQLLQDVQQNPESTETLSESQPEESEELDRIKQLLRMVPQDVRDFTKVQPKDPDLFRQADQLLQDVQPEAAIAAQAQQEKEKRPTDVQNVESPYEFDFIW